MSDKINSKNKSDSPGLTLITTHSSADFDALASMLAANLLYPDALVVFPGSQEKSLRNFFVQSVMYMMNLERPKNIDFEKVNRLVLVDTRQKGRIGQLAKLPKMKPDLDIHIYDHHPPSKDDIKGTVEYIEEIGSCTAMMTRMLFEKEIEISEDQATFLALGIYEDTGLFTFNSTTSKDLAIASELIRLGADVTLVSNLLTRELNSDQIALLNQLLENMQHVRISGVEVVMATCSDDTYQPDFAVVAHKLMDMENLNVLFAMTLMENRIHVVGRSRIEAVDVGRIAMALGGGGHPSAASATIKNQTLAEVKQKIQVLLEAQISPTRTAGEIMSFPVISVSPKASLNDAHNKLSRYSINVLPVMNNGDILGLISRQVVEKALYLGVGNQLVEEYMNPELVTIRPTATLTEIQYQIVGQRQRILPVVEGEEVVGVVTRSDLLNILMDTPVVPDVLLESEKANNFVRTRNLSKTIQEFLPQKIIEILVSMGEAADELHFNAYAVGGFVRDIIMRRSNLDIDIVVEGDGIDFVRKYAKEHDVRIRVHEKFRTAVVIFNDGLKIDVATARLEYYDSPAALPIVETSSLKLDLYRRDFTINTLAVRLNPNHFGVVVDYFGAQRDIKDRTLRLLHSLSLVEDPTRALRAIRFEQRFGFKIGKLTTNLIRNAVKIGSFNQVNPQRLLVELKNLLEEPSPAKALNRMNDFKLWPAIHPFLAYPEKIDNLTHEVHLVISWYDLLYTEQKPNNWIIFIMCLFDHLSDKKVRQVMDRLAIIPRDQTLILKSRHWTTKILATMKKTPNISNSDLYYLLNDSTIEGILFAMAKSTGDTVRRAMSLYFTELAKVKPSIDGNWLIKKGFSPGPQFRKILDDVRDARLNGLLKTISDEKKYVTRKYIK